MNNYITGKPYPTDDEVLQIETEEYPRPQLLMDVKYINYENCKQYLQSLNLPSEDYETRIKIIAKALDIL